jgi:hypothetical protein
VRPRGWQRQGRSAIWTAQIAASADAFCPTIAGPEVCRFIRTSRDALARKHLATRRARYRERAPMATREVAEV